MRIPRVCFLLLAALAACAPAAVRPSPAITSSESLIQAMHDRYERTWYRTLSFTQTTTLARPNDSTVVEEWREWASIPGGLRIEMGPPAGGRVTIFARDSTFSLNRGQLVRAVNRTNALMTVGFDVYAQPVERTLASLRAQGFDLSRFHVDTLQGTPVYVVGALRGDSTSKQFAVEADRLLFIRLLEPAANGQVMAIWFKNYERLAGGWIAPEVEAFVGTRRVLHEVYSNVRANDPVDPAMFDPRAPR
ncbi:MAG TPA: hypothetical protein VF665_12420 [Longimicrobium sp.]|jgi:hypothetical protein|uniref:hypothetical protein n=1 Tax=Longimicrobium sp. TaxID=2029185 RepID=UPI002EDB1B8D